MKLTLCSLPPGSVAVEVTHKFNEAHSRLPPGSVAEEVTHTFNEVQSRLRPEA